MSDDEQPADNVIQVNFGQPRPKPGAKPAPAKKAPLVPKYDASQFEEDPYAAKKLEVFSRFIEESKVAVTFSTFWPGVSVPAQFMKRHELVLNFSHRFLIEDFTYDEHAICASLSFGGEPFYCVVPWAAVRMMFCHATNEAISFAETI
jgi:hypothetical protein